MLIEHAAKSDVGRVRTNNEDNFALDENIGLYVVADGMGGHNAGEVASKMATDIIVNNMRQALNRQTNNLSEKLAEGIKLANQAIYEASHKYQQNQGMGTTVVAVLTQDNKYIIGWVGDSRVYLVRHNQIQQLSTDHSLVQEQIAKGLITPDQAETSDYKNVLTRALGAEKTVKADVVEVPAFDDDYLVLCSDGLTRTINDAKLLETVEIIKNPQEICDSLVNMANDNGGRDNVTIIILHKKSEGLWEKFLKTVVGAN